MKQINKDKLISAGYAIALILLTLGITVSASKVYEYAFLNNFNTGSVDIKLDQYEITESGLKTEATNRIILPEDRVSYIPEITNLRAPAYVRIKVNVTVDKEDPIPITPDDIFLMNKGWVFKNNYFYYTEPVVHGGVKDAFQGLIIQTDWLVQGKSQEVVVSACAEAIQADNFKPNFDSETPWGSVAIEEAKPVDTNNYMVARSVVVTNELTFRSNSGLEANTKDLFRGFQRYMAGSTYMDTLKIKNTASYPITVYFRTESIESKLTSKAKLDISMKDKTIYSGALFTGNTPYKKLVQIKPGKSAELVYTVSLPDDSVNEYSVLADNVTWKFKVVESKSPGTGENAMVALWLVLFMVSVMLLAFLIKKARKDKRSSED